MPDLEKIAPLFAGWEETMIWSCLQGVMGRAVWNQGRTAAAIISGDFSFLAGEPDETVLRRVPGPLLVPVDRAGPRGPGGPGDPVCYFEGAGRL